MSSWKEERFAMCKNVLLLRLGSKSKIFCKKSSKEITLRQPIFFKYWRIDG